MWIFSNKIKVNELHRGAWVYIMVLIAWGLYRLIFRLPDWIEELVLKPVMFGLPVLVVTQLVEKKKLASLGIQWKGLWQSVYVGLLFGLWLAVLGNALAFVREGGVELNVVIGLNQWVGLLLLGMSTAFWEQLLFMGFCLPRVVAMVKNELMAVGLVALMFSLLYLPLQVVSGFALPVVLLRLVLVYSLAFGNGVLMLRYKNLAAPVLAHFAWGSVIYMFG